jgi:hypothetical protein
MTALWCGSRACCCGVALLLLVAPDSGAQTPDTLPVRPSRFALGFAVDTTAVPAAWWGVDPARTALPEVVRTWRDYLAARSDAEKRATFWAAADRRRAPDPDLLIASAEYILDANAVLVDAQPLVPGDSSRWVLRTAYVGGGTAAHPGLLGMERIHVVREDGRWVLTHPGIAETTQWRHARVGPIRYVVHPAIRFDAARAAETARWAEATARRFRLPAPAPITYYQVPNLEDAFRVLGFDWALNADRVGGRANPGARVVFAADPRFGEAYRHELVHVLLRSVVSGKSVFVGEGIAYWLGGARGQPFPSMVRGLASYLDRQPTVGLRAMLDGVGSGRAASARLPAAAVIFEVVFRSGGDAGVRRFIAALGAEEPSLDTAARALGMQPAELEAAWSSVLRSYAALTPGIGNRE